MAKYPQWETKKTLQKMRVFKSLEYTFGNQLMTQWITSSSPIDYPQVLEAMEQHVQALQEGTAPERVWLLEHPPLYTAGSSAQPEDLLNPGEFPVFKTGRGGQFTYHGPGQRIAYVMIDLNRRAQDLHRYIAALEHWLIDTLLVFDVVGQRREGRVGIWVEVPCPSGHGIREEKIAAIGVRIRKWITYHGIALNLNPNLEHYSGIVPCGLPQFGVTSLHKLGKNITVDALDQALRNAWERNDFLNNLNR